MGCPNRTPSDMDLLPKGMLQMWQNEFYYLEGEVTLHDTESSVYYNLSVSMYTLCFNDWNEGLSC